MELIARFVEILMGLLVGALQLFAQPGFALFQLPLRLGLRFAGLFAGAILVAWRTSPASSHGDDDGAHSDELPHKVPQVDGRHSPDSVASVSCCPANGDGLIRVDTPL